MRLRNISATPEAHFSKVPKRFRAQEARFQTTIRLSWKAGLITYFRDQIKTKYLQIFMPLKVSLLKIQRDLCHPKYARNVSGLLRNGPQEFASQSIICRVCIVKACFHKRRSRKSALDSVKIENRICKRSWKNQNGSIFFQFRWRRTTSLMIKWKRHWRSLKEKRQNQPITVPDFWPSEFLRL